MKLHDLYDNQKRMIALELLVVELLRKAGGRVELPRRVLTGIPVTHEYTTEPNENSDTVVFKLIDPSRPLGEKGKELPVHTQLEADLVRIGVNELKAEVARNNDELIAMRESSAALFDGWKAGVEQAREKDNDT